MKTIAIPVFGSRISNRLDYSEKVLFVAIEDGVILDQHFYNWAHANPLERVGILERNGVELLICDGITEFYANQFENSPIRVIPWISGDVNEVLRRYLAGTLIQHKLAGARE